jgi:hypothetical protein
MSTDIGQEIMRRLGSTMTDAEFARAFSPEGLAPTRDWWTEDGWLVSYTTQRIRAGTLDGLFAVFVYAPKGQGSRSGKAKRWERVKLDRCDTRREAKQRALTYYYEHSPRRAERHGWNGMGYA